MDALLTAFIGDLTGRSLSFLIDRCLKKEEPTKEKRLDSLQRLLLRVRVVVEEAGERHVTNQAMLQQLTMLRKEMYRGYYTLDTFRCRSHKDDVLAGRRSFALSRFNPAKRILFSGAGSRTSSDDGGADELNQVLRSLEASIADVRECIVFLSTCPRLPTRQPYNMHMILENCMFGRQMELQHIVNFLLQTSYCCHSGDEPPGVLPIIGPKRVGKSTLVEHACNDERVRDHFSQIVFFNRSDIIAAGERSMCSGVVKHRNFHLDEGQAPMLIVVELDGDRLTENLDEDVVEVLWHRLYSAYKNSVPRGSKIIVTSQSGNIASFGTAPPLRLRFFSREAYWYFFKVLAFGAMDAAEHPKLASIATDMAVVLNRCFLGLNIFSRLLRSNADARFWSAALETLREFTRGNEYMTGANDREVHPWGVNSAVHVPSVSQHMVILDDYQQKTDQATGAEAPRITSVDLMFGRARPRGKFDVLAWRSHLPPHYSYVMSCEIRRPKRVVARKKKTTL
ncbi:unnamed protein product [Urochloa humidicola]